MAFLPKGYGKEVADSEATVARQRLNDGDYVMMHKACFVKKTQKGEAIIIEHEIVEAKGIKEGVAPTPVGTSWGHFLPMYGDAAVMCKPNLKAYVLGLLGLDEKKVSKEMVSEAVDEMGGESQVARGMLIRGITFHTNKKDDGGDFMGLNWSAIPGENIKNAPSVMKRRAELDSKTGGNVVPGGETAAPPPPNGGTQAAPPPPPAVNAAPPPPDPMVGWMVNPGAPDYFYKYVDGKPVQKLKADILAGR